MPNNACADTKSGRRHFLHAVLSIAVIGVAAQAGIELVAPEKLSAQTNLSPDAALQELLSGNQRFAANQLTSFEHDLTILKDRTVSKQEPFAAVLSCADSRVPVELIFDQTIGHIFVTRVAGNIVTPEIIASLEYGVAVLGVKALVVLGHGGCGAVKAAMKADAVPGQISSLYPKIQADLLRTSSTVIRDAFKGGKLKVEAGVYDLATGKVTLS